MIVNVETSPEYPVMNISHAAAIVLHSIASTASASPKREVVLHADLDRLLQHASDVLELIDFPTHKRQRVNMTMKRIFSRSELSAAEVRTLRGILSRIEHRLRR
jgi:tRNA/rRNA methyltransferase